MKVSCDEVQVNTSVKNDTSSTNNSSGQSQTEENSQLFERIKEYINEQFQRELNRKRW